MVACLSSTDAHELVLPAFITNGFMIWLSTVCSCSLQYSKMMIARSFVIDSYDSEKLSTSYIVNFSQTVE